MNDVDFVYFVWLSILTLAVLGSGVGTVQNVKAGFSAASKLVQAILRLFTNAAKKPTEPETPAESDKQ